MVMTCENLLAGQQGNNQTPEVRTTQRSRCLAINDDEVFMNIKC